MMNFATVGTLFRTELRMLLRDRRTVVLSIVLPLVVMPAALFSAKWAKEQREQKLRHTSYRYAVTGPNADAVRAILAAARERLPDEKSAKASATFRFRAVQSTNALAELNQGKLQLVLEGLAAKPARGKNSTPAPEARHDIAAPGAPVVRVVYRADRDDSSAAESLLENALNGTRQAEQGRLLAGRGFPLAPADVATVSDVNVASQGHVAGLALGRGLTAFLLFFILAGGAVAATDSVVGEKERGTLETLLTTAAGRREIVAAKHLLILAVALLITLIQAVNLLVYVGFRLIPIRANFAAAVPPPVGALLFVLFLPVAALAASALLLTSSYARSYKEAQFYFYPLSLLGLVPALAPLLPGLPLRSAIVLVPVANIAVAAKEILVGSFDWPMIAGSWLVTAAAAVWTTRLSARALSAENLITTVETDAVAFAGGPALFGRRVLLWYALLWAVTLIVSNYIAAADVRVQLAVNELVLLLGASWVMLRRYRLKPRLALALRAPKPAVWLAVLAAAPSGLLTGIGLFRLANLVVPVPDKVIESFSRNVLPPDMPLWQTVLFLALLPAVVEELTFRGVLLHGLHRRLRPVPLALTVGVVFGLFHVALFRLAPTIFLGVLLTATALLTGSIFPGMLWHALNNALGVLPATQQLPLTELNPSAYLLAAGILAAAFWIIWRNRTPYPGLRVRRGKNQPGTSAR